MGNWLMCLYLPVYLNCHPPVPTCTFSLACPSPEMSGVFLDIYLPFFLFFFPTSVLSFKFLSVCGRSPNKLTVGFFGSCELCPWVLGFVGCPFDMTWSFPKTSESLQWVASSSLALSMPVLRNDFSSGVLEEFSAAQEIIHKDFANW